MNPRPLSPLLFPLYISTSASLSHHSSPANLAAYNPNLTPPPTSSSLPLSHSGPAKTRRLIRRCCWRIRKRAGCRLDRRVRDRTRGIGGLAGRGSLRMKGQIASATGRVWAWLLDPAMRRRRYWIWTSLGILHFRTRWCGWWMLLYQTSCFDWRTCCHYFLSRKSYFVAIFLFFLHHIV